MFVSDFSGPACAYPDGQTTYAALHLRCRGDNEQIDMEEPWQPPAALPPDVMGQLSVRGQGLLYYVVEEFSVTGISVGGTFVTTKQPRSGVSTSSSLEILCNWVPSPRLTISMP
jgi:hypothetical protein